jgi:hypothetical protein
MKKFSKLTNQKVNEEPKLDTKIDEAQVLKYKMMDLMNRFLSLRTYGSVDNRFLSGKVKIEGKEMLAEALFDLFSDKSSMEQAKVLEGLKSKINDWETIDKEIEEFNKKTPLFKNKMKLKSILERWSSDSDTLSIYLESNIVKIDSIDTLNDYISIVSESNLNEDLKLNLVNKYSDRINQLSKY